MAKKRPLTQKQEKFCQCIVSGMSGKDSYLTAYSSTGSDQNAYTEASKLMLREDIQERIESLRKPIEKATQQAALSERERKRQVLWDIITAPDATYNDQCRAMDILNKMDSEYINLTKTIDDKKPNITSIDSETLRKLSKAQ